MLICSVAANPISATMKLNPSGDWAWAAGTDTQCTKFVVSVTGGYCEKVARFAGISTRWFMQQNPQVDQKCKNLSVNTMYCVAPPNGQPGKDSPANVEYAGQKEAKNKESDKKDTGMATPGDGAGVVLHNKSPTTVCFAFEKGAEISASNMPSSFECKIGGEAFKGVSIPPGQSRFHRLLPGFHGAISVVVNGVRGARHEMSFVSGNPPGAFYDVDYEFGLSSTTFGPFDGRPRPDGGDSRMGEADILNKINQHFRKLSPNEQHALVSAASEGFMKQGSSGDLVWV